MDIQHIRYFLAIAEHQSFSKAAQALYVTQPILTRCVKNLEKELGTPLIVRSTKSFSLTEAGQALVTHGTALLQQHRDIIFTAASRILRIPAAARSTLPAPVCCWICISQSL